MNYGQFKRKEREEHWRPLNVQERSTLKFVERWLIRGIFTLALAELVYQVCLKVMR